MPIQQARVRALRQAYIDIGIAGRFGLMMLDQCLVEAEDAQVSGDIVRIMRAYEGLKECK